MAPVEMPGLRLACQIATAANGTVRIMTITIIIHAATGTLESSAVNDMMCGGRSAMVRIEEPAEMSRLGGAMEALAGMSRARPRNAWCTNPSRANSPEAAGTTVSPAA